MKDDVNGKIIMCQEAYINIADLFVFFWLYSGAELERRQLNQSKLLLHEM